MMSFYFSLTLLRLNSKQLHAKVYRILPRPANLKMEALLTSVGVVALADWRQNSITCVRARSALQKNRSPSSSSSSVQPWLIMALLAHWQFE